MTSPTHGYNAALLITPNPAAAAVWRSHIPDDVEVAHAPDISSGAQLFDRLFGRLTLVVVDRVFGGRQSNGLLAFIAGTGYAQHLIEVDTAGSICSSAGHACRTGHDIGLHIQDCFE